GPYPGLHRSHHEARATLARACPLPGDARHRQTRVNAPARATRAHAQPAPFTSGEPRSGLWEAGEAACGEALGFATLAAMSRLSLIAGLGLCASSIAFSACKEPEVEEFGFACLELVQAASEEQNPFMNTAKIRVTLRYEDCLIEYYTQKH